MWSESPLMKRMFSKIYVLGVLALIELSAACGQGPGSESLSHVMDSTPAVYKMTDRMTLAETGLYQDFATRAMSLTVQRYGVRYPLYSDNAQKDRYIEFPVGSSVDASKVDDWVYPVGTKIWKEFRAVQNGVPRIVETRFMEKTAAGWDFGVYVWSVDGTSAPRWDGQTIPNVVSVTVPGPGHDVTVGYSIPSQNACVTCHMQHTPNATVRPEPVLGFSAFQLTQPALTQMRTSGRLQGLAVDWNAHRIPAANQLERDVAGYLHGNCSHCHNQRRTEFVSPVSYGPFSFGINVGDLHSRDDLTVVKMINRPVLNTTVSLPTSGAPLIVAPGEPTASMLYHRMAVASDGRRMPVIGVASPDQRFIDEKLNPWISALTE